MAIVEAGGMKYHMGDRLVPKWNNLKNGKLTESDEDRFYVVDGQEGAGKSLFTIQQAAYIDPTILDDEKGKSLPRICFTSDEFLYAIRHTKSSKNHTKVVIFDEAFRGMSSKGSISAVNKKVVQALMEMRQNNLVVFLVSPSFFLLELYPAMMRSKALFHVVKERNSKKRSVRIFGFKSKAELYQIGLRKGWGYPIKTQNRVNFYNKYPGGDDFERRYRKKKRVSLHQEEKQEEALHKWKIQRNAAIKSLKKDGKTYGDIKELMKNEGVVIGVTTLHDICKNN